MLVLTVQEGDYIMIDDDIRIECSPGIEEKSIRLGIDAPRNRQIARGKVYEKMMLEDPNVSPEKKAAIQEQKVKARLTERNRRMKQARTERVEKVQATAT